MATTPTTSYAIYQGNSDDIPVRITNKITGAEITVDGALAAEYGIFQIGDDPDNPTNVATKTLTDGIAIAGSLVTISLQPTDTANLVPGTYIHELELTLADGKVKTVLQGEMTILPAYLA